MCGVVAIHAYAASAPPADREELRAIRDHMAARGPDGKGEWFSQDGRVALGHRRLSIIDLSEGGAQPMASADGQCVISFNGEIYNYVELRRMLEQRGRVFASGSDTEVLLQLYEEFGTDMLDQLRGMFAFALWDGKRQAMLIARDPFGIKPLYYANDGRTVRVASQVRALLQGQVDSSMDPAGHAGFFLWGSVPSPYTLYRGIRDLPAGHFMWIRGSTAEDPQPYCSIRDVLAHAAANPAQGTQAEALEHIAAALHDSVDAHQVADVPVAAFLSAGLDSSMICSLIAGRSITPQTLTLAFGEYAGTPDDESPFAEAIARQYRTHHSTLTVQRKDFESEREKLLAAMDQPSIDGVNTWFVARAAASQGIKVALSGLGGDELFGSYPSFRDVPRIARFARPGRAVPGLGLAIRKLSAPIVNRYTSPKFAGLLEYGGTLGGAYLLRRGLYMPWELPHVMDPDMAREGWRELQSLACLDNTTTGLDRDTRLAVSALEMSWYMRNQLLRDADWAGMAHSLEIRVPLVDVKLLKDTAPWLAAHPGLTKRQVVRAAAPELHDSLLAKPKTGFTVPVREWLGSKIAGSDERGLRGWSRTIHATVGLETGRVSPRMAPVRRRVLISTIAPGNGGVNAMTAFVVQTLRDHGMEPVIAHYAPYSINPKLSVPSYKLPWGRVGTERRQTHGHCETHAVGAWLPELEFTHYEATRDWRNIMKSCDAFMVASGNVLAATPFYETGRPYLAWVATDWEGDRKERVKTFPAIRRLLDHCVNGPVIRRLESKLLRGGAVLSLSEYTAKVLDERSGISLGDITLPVPIDTQLFVPKPESRVPGRLGFAGRYMDPRKNIALLLEAAAQLHEQGRPLEVVLMGDAPMPALRASIAGLGLTGHVVFKPALSREQMRDCLQTLDIFVLPSHQEGLCIAALEAMACGVPVVSTRCGGPEEFVIQDVTGKLVAFDATEMAAAIGGLLDDEGARMTMGAAARKLTEDRYRRDKAEVTLIRAFHQSFPGMSRQDAHPALDGATAKTSNAAPAVARAA